MPSRTSKVAPALLALLAALAGPARGDDGPPLATRWREPVALALSSDGARMFAANARSGSLSVVDLAGGKVVAEVAVGRGLADLASLPDGRLVAVDRAGDTLVVVAPRGEAVAVGPRVAVAPDPATVAVAPDGRSCVVASTRSRRLTVVALPALTVERTVALPFAPRCLAWVGPKSPRLVVADAFGGKLAVVDPAAGVVASVRSLPGHNIRGLATAPDGRSLLVAHQTLNRLARSSFEDIHWGSLIGNHLRTLRVDAVLAPDPDADPLQGGHVVDLGEVGHAAADPGVLGFDGRGRVTVALPGVGEVGFGPAYGWPVRRARVGGRPTAVLTSPDGKKAYVADAAEDAITVVDVEGVKALASIPLGPRPEPGPAERGERLFFDARLSHDGWMSCQSCHTDGQSNGLVADTLGDGAYGAPKRTPSLLGVGSTGPYTWLGGVDRLEDQVRKSIETTMRGRSPTDGQVADFAAYLRSLPPPEPEKTAGQEEAVARGRALFVARKCAECHAPPDYTTPETYDVALLDEAGRRRFNPPSLRGVAGRAPLLHDGRAATLEDVFRVHRHPRDARWTPEEAADLSAFLGTL